MNELKIFKNEEFGEVRTMLINGEPYFVGKRCCIRFRLFQYQKRNIATC